MCCVRTGRRPRRSIATARSGGGPVPGTPVPPAGPRGDLGGGVAGPSVRVRGRGAVLQAPSGPGGAVGVDVGRGAGVTCRAARLSGPGAASRRGARGSSGGVTLQGDLYGRTLYRGDLYGGRRGRIGPRWGLAPHRSALWRPVAPRPKVRFGAPPFSFLLPGPQTSLEEKPFEKIS